MSIPTQISEIQRIAQNVPEAVQPLAHSNDAPTERQLDIMFAWKNSLDAALASLPDVATQNLLRRSVIIASHRLLYRSVCSAVRRLPVEVLQAIFIEFVDADSQQHGYDVFNVNVGPWPLIRVSRLWRAVGLGCPELWANISVHRQTSWARRKRPHLMRGPITLLRMALAHSGQRDLYIYFMDVGSDASTLLRALVEHSNRWRNVQLYMSSGDVHLLQDIGSRVPRLKALTYQTFCDGGPSRDQASVSLHNAPSLVELTMFGMPLDGISAALTEVVKLKYRYAVRTGRDIGFYDFLNFFFLCPNAEDVSLDMGSLPYDDAWSPLSVGLTDYILRDKITRFETSDVSLLDFLCLPALSELSLIVTAAFDYTLVSSPICLISPAPLPYLLAFLLRSRCPLKTLQLGGANLRSPTASLTDIFALTPGLERLEISYGIREFEFTQYGLSAILDGMSLLVETLSNNLELLPKLVEFVFASWACGDPAFVFADADFVAMVERRQPVLQMAALSCLGCPERSFPTLKRYMGPASILVCGQCCGSLVYYCATLRGEEEEEGSSGLVEE